jgi:enoyl-CoA hydratase
MMDEVGYDVQDGVGIIELRAPQRRNALRPETADEIVAALRRAEDDPAVGAVLLCAAGPSFCTGADLKVLRQVAPDPISTESLDSLGRIYAMFNRLVDARVATVAAVQGQVVGAGVNLALACDVRIVAEDVLISGFGRARLHPGGGHLQLWEWIDRQAGAWVALFNQSMTAADALRCGLAFAAVPAERLREAALEVARGAAGDPDLTRRIVESWRTVTAAGAEHWRSVSVERTPQVWSMRRTVSAVSPASPISSVSPDSR